jgi:uncharacterized membrane protein
MQEPPMGAVTLITLHPIAAATTLTFDMLWLTLTARDFYQAQLGHLPAPVVY